MNSLVLLVQIIVDLFFVVAVVAIWFQFRRSKSEDPRFAAGLQELQSKIAVLEDLGDRTEKQVQQLMVILENKLIDVQKKIEQADSMQGKISKSMEKSLEVVKIFQDKIPHEEIRERQSTIKFVKAAILSNQGYSIQEVSEQVDLPYGELEFIAKVNKNELSFDENQLPDWIRSELKETKFAIKDDVQFLESPLQQPQKLKTDAGLTSVDQQSLQALGEKFRQAQIVVSQHRASETQNKGFRVEAKDESEFLPPMESVSESKRSIAESVSQLVEQKRRELEELQEANITQFKAGATDSSFGLFKQTIASSPSLWAKQNMAANPSQNVRQDLVSKPLQQAKQNIKSNGAMISKVTGTSDSTQLPKQATSAQLFKQATASQVSKQATVSHKQTTSAQLFGSVKSAQGNQFIANAGSASVYKVEPVQLGQESKILKKGKELGIRPVVFPRIEVDKK